MKKENLTQRRGVRRGKKEEKGRRKLSYLLSRMC